MSEILKFEQLYKKCFNSIIKLIEEIFPFENKKAFLAFREYMNKRAKNLRFINTDEDFFIFVKKFVAGLNNSHTKIGGYPWKIYKPTNYDVILINEKFFLKRFGKVLGELMSVDGKSPTNILNEAIEMISGSTKPYLESQGLKFVLADKEEKVAEIELKIKKRIVIKKLKRTQPIFKENHLIIRKIGGKITYFKVPNWKHTGIALEQKITQLLRKGGRALILDLRGNLGGNSAETDIFSSHFFKNKVLFGTEKQRISNKNLKLKKRYYFIEPKSPYWNIPLIFIVDSECFSSCESFIAGMKDSGRALIIGETTGGGTGNPKKFTIPCGKLSLELYISTWIYRRTNGQLIEGKGIEPDIFIKPNLNSLINKKDVALKRAIIEAKKLI